MAKNPRKSQAPPSKKHQDRMNREKIQSRWIMITSLAVLIAVVGLIVYGILEQRVLRFSRTVATVNGERISGNEFREFTRYYRNTLIQNASSAFQLVQMFGGDMNAVQSFGGQLIQISDDLDAFSAGSTALDQMITDRLIRQEAKKRGITVSKEEIEQAMEEAFRYYPDGTPTPTQTTAPFSTATLSPTQLALLPPTSTPTEIPTPTATLVVTETSTVTVTLEPTQTATPGVTSTPVLTPTAVITATATPLPTATPYTEELYKSDYATLVANLGSINIPEQVIRYVIESQLYQEKLMKEVIGQVDCHEEEVWAQHILVADEATAQKVYQQAIAGDDWFKLAKEYSTDTSNKDKGGDLGWFGTGKMVPEFEAGAFALTTPGEISQPVQTQFGWHIIRLVAKQNRPLGASECETKAQTKFKAWVDELTQSSTIVKNTDAWQAIVPLQPTMPADIESAINSMRQILQQQQQPQFPQLPLP